MLLKNFKYNFDIYIIIQLMDLLLNTFVIIIINYFLLLSQKHFSENYSTNILVIPLFRIGKGNNYYSNNTLKKMKALFFQITYSKSYANFYFFSTSWKPFCHHTNFPIRIFSYFLTLWKVIASFKFLHYFTGDVKSLFVFPLYFFLFKVSKWFEPFFPWQS